MVNHRTPHRGNQKLFWDRTNWEPACAPCHDGEIKREEMGLAKAVDRQGRPIDPNHPWNRSGSTAEG